MAKKSFDDVRLDFVNGRSVSFDFEAFNDLMASQGVQLVHYRAMRCPIGLKDATDVRKSDDCSLDCSNGFVYTKAGNITGIFTGNSKREQAQEYGWLQDASANLTLPTHYEDEKIVHLARYDRLYLCEENITVGTWQLVEAHATSVDRLDFPAVEIIDLVDSRGKVYRTGDYSLVNGKIKWVSQNQPGQDIATGKGVVYAVRYTYRPYWYIKSFNHEVRVSQTNMPIEGMPETERKIHRLPYEVSVQREYFFQNQVAKDETPDTNPRAIQSPPDGGFGQR